MNNTQVIFTSTELIPGSDLSLEFTATLMVEGVEVKIDGGDATVVDWLQLEDVESLANLFWSNQVWEFREIVKLLGQANQARHLIQ